MNFDDKKVLIAYYSRRGENYVNGDVKNLEKGNTEIIAEFIQEFTDGDIFIIDSVKEYSPDYFKCIEEAKEELENNVMVELKENINNLNDYDFIFLGYPNWWGTIPMVVATFICLLPPKALFYVIDGTKRFKLLPFVEYNGAFKQNTQLSVVTLCLHCAVSIYKAV